MKNLNELFFSKGWMEKTASDWAKNNDCNVCAVDWSKISGTHAIQYPIVATFSTVVTANAIHRFISFLEKNGMNITDVVIAGHR